MDSFRFRVPPVLNLFLSVPLTESTVNLSQENDDLGSYGIYYYISFPYLRPTIDHYIRYNFG